MNNNNGKHTAFAAALGLFLLIVSAGLYSLAVFFMGILVFGCQNSLPDWTYMIVVAGVPVPLIVTDVLAVYLFYKRKNFAWVFLTVVAGVCLCTVIYVIWFAVMSQYC